MRLCSLFVLIGFLCSISFGGVGQWKSYTVKRQVRAIAADSRDPQLLWVATSGGMYSYSPSKNSFKEFTTSEGLRSIDLTAIASDNRGAIWIGVSNGIIHRYYPSTGEWQYVMQIAEDKDHGTSKRINTLRTYGDSLFILSDIGVNIFSVSSLVFIENFLHPLVTKAKALEFFDKKIWIGTDNGIACTPDSNPNPSAPDGWQLYNTVQGLPSNSVLQLGTFNGKLMAATTGGLAVFNNNLWTAIPGTSDVIGFEIKKSAGNLDSLFFITSTQNQLKVLSSDNNILTVAQFDYPLSAIFSSTLLGTESDGLLAFINGGWVTINPPGPPSNRFIGIAVDEKGVVWSGTGKSSGQGFMSFDGKQWRIYNKQQYPEFHYDDFFKVSLGANGSKWISNWGGGVVLVDGDGKVQKTLNVANGIPPCIIDDPTYAVVTGVAVDRNGLTWISSRTPPGDTILTQFLQDSSLHYMTGCILSNCQVRNPLNYFTDVVIDNYGTKWFANYIRYEPLSTIGLFYYNENITLPGTVNGWGRMTTSDEQTIDKVSCISIGHEGDVWLGTWQGITIIFDPSDPTRNISQYHPLRDQIVQSIMVDALDNKWVATQQNGVFVLSPDGTSILEKYNVESTNGKLLDNDVNSIAIDNNTGTVYFGTEKGLSSLTTPAVTPVQTLGTISFTPNPFYIPASNELVVDGLVRSSSMKILSVDGKLVREIQTPGGRIGFWDGRNKDGELVSTGIYFVVISSDAGDQIAIGKVAVIRK